MFLSLLLATNFFGQKKMTIHKLEDKIKIDGSYDESDWQNHLKEVEFIQNRPESGKVSNRKTEIAMAYDESNLYVLAVMHTNGKDEVNKPLTPRDDTGNADFFAVQMDPFGQAREGYDFTISAAGVQSDFKLVPGNAIGNFNVLWISAVQVYDSMWVAEIQIPLNSIRFPKDNFDSFRINFQRVISATNEDSYWSEIKPEVDGYMNQYGILEGLGKVNPPLNLSLYPFTSVVSEKSPFGDKKTTLNGGLDLKYVHNNAYTLDVSLIPDFSQAPSDDQIFNLSPFEIQFNENRQFFVEGTEIFDKGGYLYTRRIGGRPINQFNIELGGDEEIISNPVSTNILNLVKVSGKSENGLSVGVLNGITDRSHAEVKNSETGEIRKVETSPYVNYNSIVLDKALKNNSSLTFINNSVLRGNSGRDENLTALMYRYYNKKRTYSAYFKKAVSQEYNTDSDDVFGHQYYAYLSRVSGKVRGGISANIYDKDFNNNGLGFLPRNNELTARASINYSNNNPKKIFSNYMVGFDHYQRYFFETMDLEYNYYKFLSNAMLKKWNHNIFAEYTFVPERKDFYESRKDNRVFIKPAFTELFLEYQTNRNKNISFSGYLVAVDFKDDIYKTEINAGYGVDYRLGQHLSFNLNSNITDLPSAAGFIDTIDDEIIFGQRSVNELSHSLRINYAVNPKLNLSVRARHYWIQVDYLDQYTLTDNGDLIGNDHDLDVNVYDDNFNTFNVDAIATWQFAPASELSLGYKLQSSFYDTDIKSKFFENLHQSTRENVGETISLKMTYFFDYNKLRKRGTILNQSILY